MMLGLGETDGDADGLALAEGDNDGEADGLSDGDMDGLSVGESLVMTSLTE
jgi:hypothetical protein